MLSETRNKLKLIIGFIAITALFIIGGAYAVNLPSVQAEAGKWVAHTRQVILQLTTLSMDINIAEANERGYMLTADKGYLRLYMVALADVPKDVAGFQQLTADNPDQQNRALALQKNTDALISLLKGHVGQRTAVSGEEIKLISDINAQIREMKAEETELLKTRSQAWQTRVDGARAGFFIGGLLLYLVVCIAGAAMLDLVIQRRKLIVAEREAAALHKKRAEHLNQILKIQRDVVGHSGNLQMALQKIADKAMELINAEGAVVEMRDGDEMVYRAASGSGVPFVGMRINMEGSFTGLCMKRGHILKCDDSETDARVNADACRKVGLRSMLVVPLRNHTASIGVLKILGSKPNAFSEDDVATLELMMGLMSATLSDAVTADAMRLSNFELNAANITLEKMASTDGLTGLQNRRTFQEFLSREYDLAIRYKRPLSLVILDVDHFKKFNDGFGHPAGDVVLQRVAALLTHLARRTDCVARYGGEEFVLLLPQTGPEDALIIANRIQQSVAGDTWEHRPITVSVGVSSLGETNISSADDLLKSADKALYAAKEGGRNRVVKYA
jgi:diguanylate cyclase (GGDEF)-like protein